MIFLARSALALVVTGLVGTLGIVAPLEATPAAASSRPAARIEAVIELPTGAPATATLTGPGRERAAAAPSPGSSESNPFSYLAPLGLVGLWIVGGVVMFRRARSRRSRS